MICVCVFVYEREGGRERETHLVDCYKAQQKKIVGGKRAEKTSRQPAKARAFLELIGGARLVGCRLSEGRGCLWLLGVARIGEKGAALLRLGAPAGTPPSGRRNKENDCCGEPSRPRPAAWRQKHSTSMGTLSPSSSSIPSCQDACPTYDELSMQQSLLFSDMLKDLKNLRSQLYSAAEYFELSFTNDEQNQIVVDTLKDYAIKALVNTVDHLGSVSYKVNDLLDEKFDEVSGTELRVCCMEQRLRTCQEFIDLEGLSQQSLVISTPKYHKRYILPVSGSMPECGRHAVAHHQEKHQSKEDREPLLFQPCLQPTIKDRSPSFRKVFSSSPSQRARSNSPARKIRSQSPSPLPGKSQVSEKKRAPSPVPTPNLNPLLRSGSLSCRSNVPISSNHARWMQLPTKAQKSASMRLHAERDEQEDTEHNPSKSKRLLKALLSRRKSKKDEMLYRYIDDY